MHLNSLAHPMEESKTATDLFPQKKMEPALEDQMEEMIGWMIGQCFIGAGGFLGVPLLVST